MGGYAPNPPLMSAFGLRNWGVAVPPELGIPLPHWGVAVPPELGIVLPHVKKKHAFSLNAFFTIGPQNRDLAAILPGFYS